MKAKIKLEVDKNGHLAQKMDGEGAELLSMLTFASARMLIETKTPVENFMAAVMFTMKGLSK